LSLQLHRLRDEILEKIRSTHQTLTQTGYFLPFPCEEFEAELDEKEREGIQCSLLSKAIQHWPATRTTKDLSLHVHVTTAASEDKPHQYALTYLTEAGEATWSPQYDIRYEGDLHPTDFTYTLHIELYAHIDQNTGEDWKDAQLTLSTSSPVQLDPPPPNHQLTVQFRTAYQEERLSGGVRERMRSKTPQMAMMKMEMEMMADAMVEASIHSAGDMGVSYLFQPAHRSTILTREHKASPSPPLPHLPPHLRPLTLSSRDIL
jgi:hypothetical protein